VRLAHILEVFGVFVMFSIRNQTLNDLEAAEHLLDLSFGTDRKSKSAYALRKGLTPVSGLTLAAELDGELVGSIQFWPLQLSLTAGTVCPPGILLLGPLAVHPDRQNLGLGKALVEEGLKRAEALKYSAAILVGDPAYYAKFGFGHACVSGLTLQAEADQKRIQGRELTVGSLTGLQGKIISAGD
jgi:predicted N-acetyltransferase YhbS